ncbi:MAG TPA: radical SAM family heme chaperone HemW [Gemmatimonadaceae bacterium]|nr:radical SAM family heme chaperone HemW [Gemmatimonadaceae bacterium]
MPPRHIYIHVPFCARRCSYCDFAIAVRRRVPVDEYVDTLARELELRWPTPSRSAVETIYLGGGTPSLIGPEGVARVIDVVSDRFPPASNAEITIEANPDDVDAASVAAWCSAGVNRVSLGVQSFDDRALTWMHRSHDSTGARRAVDHIRDGGIGNWSLDLIFSLSAELGRNWERDVAAAIALEPSHVSLYGLTIEPHTPIARWRDRGSVVEAPEETYEREYLYAHDTLAAAGYEHYEVSNFARPGCGSRHNSGYWTGASYVGLGPAAHGFDGIARRWNEREYAAWVRRVGAGEDPVAGTEILSRENRVSEAVYLGLRTSNGLVLCDGEQVYVQPWIDAGWGSVGGARLRLTPKGWLRLDALAASLTVLRSR